MVDGEGTQIPLVDPYQACPGAEGPVQLGLVVDLHQRRQPEGGGPPVEPLQLFVGERGHDEQHGVAP